MNFDTFAWAKVTETSLMMLGFQSSDLDDPSRTACDIVEDHVGGVLYVDEMALIEVGLQGDMASGNTFDIVSNPSQASGNTWGQANLTIDEGDPSLMAESGTGSILSYAGEGSPVELNTLTLGFGSNGSMGSTITACYCEDVSKFWDTEVPDDGE